jgi:hypothetical protein
VRTAATGQVADPQARRDQDCEDYTGNCLHWASKLMQAGGF